MDRITVKLHADTHAKLINSLPALSAEAGRMLTTTGAIEYLIEMWKAQRTAPPHPSWLATLEPNGPSDAQA